MKLSKVNQTEKVKVECSLSYVEARPINVHINTHMILYTYSYTYTHTYLERA
jgi:hypothetical protein